MKLTLPGLCGLILATAVLKVGIDAFQSEAPLPIPADERATAPQGARSVLPTALLSRLSGELPGSVAALPAWIKPVGQLRLVKWGNSASNGDRETVVLRDERGRTVARIAGYRVEIERIQDLTADGIPEVVLRTWSGGAHGAFVYYTYSAGPRPRCLLAYFKNNDEDDPAHWPNFEVKDLYGDGSLEIVTTYDGFAYWCEVSDWATSYAGSARMPIVLGLRRGRYVDITSDCRSWLRLQLARAKQSFLDDLIAAGQRGPVNEFAQGMIEYHSVALMLHGRATARRMVVRLLSPQDRSYFLENCGQIEKVVAERWQRYAYPPAYGSAQAFEGHAVP